MDRVDLISGKLVSFLALFAAVLVGVIMVVMLLDVIGRNFRGGSVPGARELSVVLLVTVAFLGFGYAERADKNIKLTFLTSRLPARSRFVAQTFSSLVTLSMVAWFSWATWHAAARSFERRESQIGLLNTPLWPTRIIIAVGFTLLAIEVVLGIRRRWKDYRANSASDSGTTMEERNDVQQAGTVGGPHER